MNEKHIRRRGMCVALTSPSGAGKSSISREVLKEDPAIALSISMTTRSVRPGETDGVDYHFVDEDAFLGAVDRGDLIEHARVFKHWYGTPKQPVVDTLEDGRDVMFDIDWQGVRQLRAALPNDVVGIFILPPSAQALVDRLSARGQDSPEEMAHRMAKAHGEASHWDEFDYVLINDDFDESVRRVRSILTAERLSRVRQPGLASFVKGLALDAYGRG